MDSPLSTDQPDGFVFDLSTPLPVSLPSSPADTQVPLPAPSPGIGAIPWIAGGVSLVICWPFGIAALITAFFARSASRERVEAVEADNLYDAARLLARSRHYRNISLGCSALGVVIVFVLLLLVALGTIAGPGFG